MPRLPGPEALGNLPSLRPPTEAQASPANPIAEAAGRVGQGMVALSDAQRERDDALQLSEADAHLTTGLTDLRRRFATDADWRTYQPRFQAEADRIRAEAASRITNPSLLRRWSPRADVAVSGAFDTVLGRQSTLRGEEEFDRIDQTLSGLTSSYVTAADDASRAAIMRNIEDTIELGRRSGIVSAERIRDLRRRHLHGAFEADADARLLAGDGYAALLELREGDARATAPSSGEVSELGLSHIQRLTRPPGQTAPQSQADLRRLRTEAARVSQWIGSNMVGPDGQPISLTQLQHDALVGFALSRRGSKPEDALAELLPSIRTGNWESVASAIRAGGLFALEEGAPRTAPGAAPPTTPPTGRARPLPRFAPEVDSAIVAAAQRHGIDPDLMRRIAAIESSGDPRAVTGSYRGLFQLSAQEFGGQGDIFSPTDNANAAAANFARHIADFRQRHGREPTAGDLYLIHQQGAGGFAAHMAEPARLAWQSMFSTAEGRQRGERWARQAISGNLPPGVLARLGGVENITSQQFMDYWRGRVEGAAPGAPPSAPGAPTPAPVAAPGNDEFGDMVIGQAPSSRYVTLPLDRRRALIRRLSESLRPEVVAEIERDIESIRQTGEPRQLPDGTTWISRAPRILTGMQAARIQQRVAEARAQFEAIHGLTDMTPADMGARLDEIDSVGDAEDGTTPRTRRFVAGVIRRITELRRTDPALWASGTYVVGEGSSQRVGENGQIHTVPAQDDLRVQPAREVTQAYELLARRYPHMQIQVGADGEVTYQPESGALGGGQAQPQRLLLTDPRLTPEDRRLIIEARVAAMARVGIPDGDRYVLRADEAAQILRLPADLTRLSQQDFARHLREGADRATAIFGPAYARAAFDAALHFRRLSGRNLEDAQGESGRLGGRLAALDREESLWRTGAAPVGVSPFAWPVPGNTTMFGGVRPSEFTISPDQALPGAMALAPPPGTVDRSMFGLPGVGPIPTVPTSPTAPPTAFPPVTPQSRGTGVPGVSAQAWPRPTPEMISRLARLPAMQEEFDRTFGPGSAAHYLSLLGQSQAPRR